MKPTAYYLPGQGGFYLSWDSIPDKHKTLVIPLIDATSLKSELTMLQQDICDVFDEYDQGYYSGYFAAMGRVITILEAEQ